MGGGLAVSDVELSDEMKEAIRILREDGIIENTRKAREANEALLKRLEERDVETKAWRDKIEERTKPAELSPTPENDPTPTPGVPPAPAPVDPGEKQPGAKKRRGIWFQAEEEREEKE
jgi:hypothetical protein